MSATAAQSRKTEDYGSYSNVNCITSTVQDEDSMESEKQTADDNSKLGSSSLAIEAYLNEWNQEQQSSMPQGQTRSPAIESATTPVEYDNECRVVCTAKGRKAIAFRGYTYRFDKLTNSGVCKWRCTADFCRGRLSTMGHNPPAMPEEINIHNHGVDEPKSRRWRKKKEMHNAMFNQAPYLLDSLNTAINQNGEVVHSGGNFIVDSVTGEVRPVVDPPKNAPATGGSGTLPSNLPASQALTNAVTQAMLMQNGGAAKKPKMELQEEMEWGADSNTSFTPQRADVSAVAPLNPVRTAKDPTKEAPVFNATTVQQLTSKDKTKEAPLYPVSSTNKYLGHAKDRSPAIEDRVMLHLMNAKTVNGNPVKMDSQAAEIAKPPPLVRPPGISAGISGPVNKLEPDNRIENLAEEEEVRHLLRLVNKLSDPEMNKRLITQQIMKIKDERQMIREQSLLYAEQR